MYERSHTCAERYFILRNNYYCIRSASHIIKSTIISKNGIKLLSGERCHIWPSQGICTLYMPENTHQFAINEGGKGGSHFPIT